LGQLTWKWTNKKLRKFWHSFSGILLCIFGAPLYFACSFIYFLPKFRALAEKKNEHTTSPKVDFRIWDEDLVRGTRWRYFYQNLVYLKRVMVF